MSFQPILPLSGYTGWAFLTRTLDRQQEAFNGSAPIRRATDHFRDKIAGITSAEELVADRRLLEVALGAFGLEADINARAFIRKVLQEGTLAEDAFANRLADKRYAAMARAFGFGDSAAETHMPGFGDRIVALYEQRQFESAVGAQNPELRQALNFASTITEIAAQNQTVNGRWFAVMGNPSLRNMFETALGLPASFSQIDLDQQLTTFRDRASRVFGTDDPAQLADPARQEEVIRMFLVRSEILASAGGLSAGQAALSLLQAARR